MTRTDPMIKLHQRPHYYFNKIYSTSRNTWFHDLMDNGNYEDTPRYWHIFVGVNTRYLVAYPLQGKSNEDVQKTLLEFIQQYRPEKLTSDNEPAFTSKSTCQLCTNHHVKVFVVTDKQHSSLGVIDRVIRTLRDMNTPKHHNEQSHHKQFNTISKAKMSKLILQYNNTKNSTTKCKPVDMFENKDLEIKFIHRNQKYKHVQRGIKDFALPMDSYVRYRIAKDPLVKHRYRYSPESYKVVGKERAFYTIQAQDGSTLVMPRWKLIQSDESIYPYKALIPNSNTGTIKKILRYNKRTDKYTVLFDGSNKEYIISASELRHRTPQVMTKIEKEYFKQFDAKHK